MNDAKEDVTYVGTVIIDIHTKFDQKIYHIDILNGECRCEDVEFKLQTNS